MTDELDYIKNLNQQNTILKVAVNPDRKPYSYYENGEIRGIIPRIFKEVAKRIGINYEIVVVKTKQEYQKLLEQGEIDICLDEIYAVSEADKSGYELTDPYLKNNNELLKRFIEAKKIEGCSEKTLSYYRKTIKNMFASTCKEAMHIMTEYLTEYQNAKQLK